MTQAFQSIEPATGALLWQGNEGDPAAEVERAERAWPAWHRKPITSRSETLRRFANQLLTHEDSLADLIARETGRPVWDAREEITASIARVEQTIAAYASRSSQTRQDAGRGGAQALRHRPLGLVAVVGTRSQPLLCATGHLLPALMAGNSVVFKPSEKTPATGARIVELGHAAGIPEQALRCLQGGAQTAQALMSHPAVRAILFTGSTRTGLAIAKALGANPEKLLALDMSGNNPLVLWDTPDLASAAALVVQSAFLSGGQRCTCARRLIVKASLYEQAMAQLEPLVDRLIIDHPHADPAPYIGPMPDMATADALTDAFLYLMSHGGRPIRHMQRPNPDLPFISPGLIDVTGMARKPDAELFGPVLQIVRVETFDDALREAAATRYGLSAGLIGGGPEHFDRFWTGVRAGLVNWNRPTTMVPPSAALGWSGLSGNHRAGGNYVADSCVAPVASAEADQPRASVGIGLSPAAPIIADR